MVFKVRKIPRHLIIEDEYSRQSTKFGIFKVVFLTLAVIVITLIASAGLMQI